MLWRTHVFAGVNTLWLFRLVPGALPPDRLPVFAVCAALGALLPDLDASASKIRSLSVGGVQPFSPIGEIAHRKWGHRGFLHSPAALLWFGLLLIPLALLWSLPVALALWLGFASHLSADALTPSGIPFRAGSGRRLHLLPRRLWIVTGSDIEEIVLALLLVSALALVLSVLWVNVSGFALLPNS